MLQKNLFQMQPLAFVAALALQLVAVQPVATTLVVVAAEATPPPTVRDNGSAGAGSLGASAPSPAKIPAPMLRVAAYNVLFGNWAEPERVGAMLLPYKLDVVALSEVPHGDWTLRVGRALGMHYAYVGDISSANHQDKYKSILSRTPLGNLREIEINASGWSPASVVVADTIVRGLPVTVLSTHIPGRPYFTDSAAGSAAAWLAESVIAPLPATNLVLLGDLNHLAGDAPLECLDKLGMHAIWGDLQIDLSRLSTHRHIESGTESGVIDHIYLRPPAAKAVEGSVIDNAYNPPTEDRQMPRYRIEWERYGKPLSDHRPIWAACEFPAKSVEVATIVALGDSITKGVRPGVTHDATFTAVLDRRLRAEGLDSIVLNLGIGGERTDQAIERLDDVIGMRPRFVTIMYGTNDSAIDSGKVKNRVALPHYREHLIQMITRLRAAHIEPILMTAPSIATPNPDHGIAADPNKQLAIYVDACRDVAREQGVMLIDHFAHWTAPLHQRTPLSPWTTDGCHPNPTGHEQIAETMLPNFLSLLTESTGRHQQ
jgi:lysophospholipase L1-like esterase/endonuclease/exonuclease/phosphatase family metal-dependent hydrolase